MSLLLILQGGATVKFVLLIENILELFLFSCFYCFSFYYILLFIFYLIFGVCSLGVGCVLMMYCSVYMVIWCCLDQGFKLKVLSALKKSQEGLCSKKKKARASCWDDEKVRKKLSCRKLAVFLRYIFAGLVLKVRVSFSS